MNFETAEINNDSEISKKQQALTSSDCFCQIFGFFVGYIYIFGLFIIIKIGNFI